MKRLQGWQHTENQLKTDSGLKQSWPDITKSFVVNLNCLRQASHTGTVLGLPHPLKKTIPL